MSPQGVGEAFGFFLAESVQVARQQLGIVNHFVDGRREGFLGIVNRGADIFDHVVVRRDQFFPLLDVHRGIINA